MQSKEEIMQNYKEIIEQKKDRELKKKMDKMLSPDSSTSRRSTHSNEHDQPIEWNNMPRLAGGTEFDYGYSGREFQEQKLHHVFIAHFLGSIIFWSIAIIAYLMFFA